jgi:hypothetical protein
MDKHGLLVFQNLSAHCFHNSMYHLHTVFPSIAITMPRGVAAQVTNITAACKINAWPQPINVTFDTPVGQILGAQYPNTTYAVTFSYKDPKSGLSAAVGRAVQQYHTNTVAVPQQYESFVQQYHSTTKAVQQYHSSMRVDFSLDRNLLLVTTCMF